MKTKALTGLALVTALSACGGGGGGGTNFTPIKVSDLGTVDTSAISNGFASAIQQVAGDGLVDAKETLSVFKWVDANENINTTELAKYNVTVNGTKMSLQRAWFMLKGYKALYYDGKETFWENMIENEQYDDTDSTFVELKALAEKDDPNYAEKIGKGTKSVEEFKQEKNVVTLVSTTTSTITTDSDPVVGEPTVTTTYVDSSADTLLDDGRTKTEVTRTYTHTSKTPSTITTTTYTQYLYTYSNGTTNIANGPQTKTSATTYTTTISTEEKIISTSYTEPAVIETDRSESFDVSTKEDTTSVVSDPVITTTYSDTEDSGVVQENGDTLYTTTRTYTDKSVVTTTTTVTTTETSIRKVTIKYSDGTTEVVTDDPVITVTPVTTSEDTVTTSTRTELLSTRTESGVIESESIVYSVSSYEEDPVVIVNDPIVTTTYVDTEDNGVLQDNGDKLFTTTRTYTDTSTTKTETTIITVQTRIPTKTIKFTNGKIKKVVGDPIITKSSETTVSISDPVITTRTEVLSTRTVEKSITKTTEEKIKTVSDPVISDSVTTSTYVDNTEEINLDDGRTKIVVTRTYTYTTKVPSTITTTEYIKYTNTYSDGSVVVVDGPKTVTPVTTYTETSNTEDKVISTSYIEATVIDTVETYDISTSKDTTIVDGDPVVTTTYVDEEDAGVLQDNGDTIFTTTRTYTDKTTVTTSTTITTTETSVKTTVIKYANGATKTIIDDPVVTVTPVTTTKDTVTTSTRTEVISTRTVEAVVEPSEPTVISTNTFVDNLVYSHLDKTYGPETTTSEDIVTYSGSIQTTTRRATTCKIEYHEHFDKRETITRTTYSDGTKKDVIDSTEYFTRGKVNKFNHCDTVDTIISVINTDDGVIGEDHADMGTRTTGYNSDPNSYITDEYNYISNKQLSVSNFSSAYSRGWTGKNSLITIADTGANINHTDLNDNIKHTIDYSGTSISESSSHGTHVAGIAGAEKNGSGMHGAAFDADLAIAKVAGGYSYSFSNAKNAAAWGRDKGSVAINVSAEVRYDTGFRNSIVKKTDGEWYSTHWYYGTNGYNGAVNEAVGWKSALGNEQVLVKAAGNAGYDYSAGMNQMATATDANGNLILDGQMIIVGNWDENNKQINGSSNKAGTVCATYQNNVCIDAAKIKDYYIMANGTNITSTAEDGGYVTMTGTSMAAPVVTGSIAVLHQMWPHMKGKHLVQLVLVTGNKNIAGYNENVHGQGLLDMDKATRPVGATGIPTTGRTNGGVSSVIGGANVGGVSASQMQALTGVMILDSFERDFYIDLGDMTQSVDTRTASVAKQMGAVNYYGNYMNAEQHAVFPKFILDDNTNIEVGFGTSDKHYLGNSFSGTLGTTKDSTTLYANYNYKKGGLYAQAGLGFSTVNFDTTNSLLTTKTANVISSTATVGYEVEPSEGHKLGFSISQPVTVEDAKLDFSVPTSRTLDGEVKYESKTVNFKNNKREIDFGTYYTFNIRKTGNAEIDDFTSRLGLQGNVNTFAEIRTGVSALQKEIEKVAGFSVQLKF